MLSRLACLSTLTLLALSPRPAYPAAPPRPAGDLLGTAFAPDGRTLAWVGRDGVLQLWDVGSGRLLWRAETARFPTYTRDLSLLDFSPDGKFVALGCADRSICVWDVAGGRQCRRVVSPRDPVQVRFAQGGKVLLAAAGTAVYRWDVATGKALKGFAGWDSSGKGVSRTLCVPSPDGETMLVTDWSGRNPRMTLVSAATGRVRSPVPAILGWPGTVAFSRDGRTLAVPGDFQSKPNVIRLLEVATGRERGWLLGAPRFVAALAFSWDGRLLACAGHPDTSVRVWRLPAELPARRFEAHSGLVKSLAFFPDGSRLLSAGLEGTALTWDVRPLTAPPERADRLSQAELNCLWRKLTGDDAEQAFQAVSELARHAGQSVPFLSERLRLVVPADLTRVWRLIAELDDEHFARREQANAELEKLGVAAEAALRQALEQRPSLELKLRVERLLRRLGDPKTRPPAGVIVLRMLEALELAGTGDARKVVAGLAGGPEQDDIVRASQGALQRLEARKTGKSR